MEGKTQTKRQEQRNRDGGRHRPKTETERQRWRDREYLKDNERWMDTDVKDRTRNYGKVFAFAHSSNKKPVKRSAVIT